MRPFAIACSLETYPTPLAPVDEDPVVGQELVDVVDGLVDLRERRLRALDPALGQVAGEAADARVGRRETRAAELLDEVVDVFARAEEVPKIRERADVDRALALIYTCDALTKMRQRLAFHEAELASWLSPDATGCTTHGGSITCLYLCVGGARISNPFFPWRARATPALAPFVAAAPSSQPGRAVAGDGAHGIGSADCACALAPFRLAGQLVGARERVGDRARAPVVDAVAAAAARARAF